jgi:NAD(P)-dependent dehydrogenase (short-subunit alcohol dehydrogenase family)
MHATEAKGMLRRDMVGKVALVVGGSSGIGRATAEAFAEAGASVVIAARRDGEGRATAERIVSQGGEAKFVRADVVRESDVAALVKETVSTYGRLDFAFNNAGIEGHNQAIVEETEANFDAVFGVNVKGMMFCMKHEIPAMLASGGGAIVNMASMVGHISYANGTVYGASKHAVIGLSAAAALEYARSGIRINTVSPGAIQTDMIDRITGTDEARATFADEHPMGRFGLPEEVASTVLFLCSNQASFITGHALAIDGGYMAR